VTPLAAEAGLRVQLAEDSQRHLDRALMAEARLTRAEAERDTYAKSNVSALIALNSAFAYAEALAGALEEIASDPHCSYDHPSNGAGQYGTGVTDGHRCAAKKADAALAAWRARDEAGKGE